LKDKKEEAGNTGAVTLSWSNGNVEVKTEE